MRKSILEQGAFFISGKPKGRDNLQYVEVKVLHKMEVAEDKLGNPVYEVLAQRSPYVGLLSGKVRLPQDLEGRTVAENNLEVWTNVPEEVLRNAAGLEIGGDRFAIQEVYAELRGGWSLVTLDGWRQGARGRAG